jgi:hypothetical protein
LRTRQAAAELLKGPAGSRVRLSVLRRDDGGNLSLCLSLSLSVCLSLSLSLSASTTGAAGHTWVYFSLLSQPTTIIAAAPAACHKGSTVASGKVRAGSGRRKRLSLSLSLTHTRTRTRTHYTHLEAGSGRRSSGRHSRGPAVAGPYCADRSSGRSPLLRRGTVTGCVNVRHCKGRHWR